MSEFDFDALNIIEKKLIAYSHEVDDLQNRVATLRRVVSHVIDRLENALEAIDGDRTDIAKEFIWISLWNLNSAMNNSSREADKS